MQEEKLVIYLKALASEVRDLKSVVTKLDTDVRNLRIGGKNTVVKVMPFGIKDISSAQLVDAYRRGLNMEQLIALGNNKYNAEQVFSKLRKAGAIQ